ncbi:hypothetical protein JCM10550A_00740 [Methanogenium cariaci]|jgi:hypothetical protein
MESLEKWFACLHADIKPGMAVGADAEGVPRLNPEDRFAVHAPALVDAGKNGSGAAQPFG